MPPLTALPALIGLLAVAGGSSSMAQARPVCAAATPACDVRTARAYFADLLRSYAEAAPLADTIRVTEQGLVANSRTEFLALLKGPNPTVGFSNMRIVADAATGQVAVFIVADVRPPGEAPYVVRRVQRMKIVRGLITETELVIFKDATARALWPDA